MKLCLRFVQQCRQQYCNLNASSLNLYTFMNVLRNCTLKFWLLIDKLKVYGIRFTTFGSGGGGYFLGGSLFSAGLLLSGGGSLFSDLTSSHKKIDVNFGASLLWELYVSLEMNHPLWPVLLSHSVCICKWCTKVVLVKKMLRRVY